MFLHGVFYQRITQPSRLQLVNVNRSRFVFPEVAIRNLKFTLSESCAGVLAQLVERLNGIEEVTGSNPVGSTSFSLGERIAERTFVVRRNR